MKLRAAAALAALLPLLAACATTAPALAPSIEVAQSATPTPEYATPTPLIETPTPTPTPTAEATTVAAAPAAAPSPAKTSASPKATTKPTTSTKTTTTTNAAPASIPDSCRTQVLALNAKGACVTSAQQALKQVGIFTGTVNGTFGQGTANAVLNYQRSRGLSDTGTTTSALWDALASGRSALGMALPASCRTGGVVLCASKADRKLYYVKNGAVTKTVQVRFGGMTRDDNSKLKIYQTVKGTYSVYAKDAKAYSDRWEASMPYSIKFDPNMYVHYSGDFAKNGYTTASHGCVNVRTMADAKWLFDNTPVGARVVVY